MAIIQTSLKFVNDNKNNNLKVMNFYNKLYVIGNTIFIIKIGETNQCQCHVWFRNINLFLL